MLKSYYPEMREPKPAAEIEARMSHSGRHWYIDTPLTLKGCGIKYLGTLTADQLTREGQWKVGWHEYRVTNAAFDRLTERYDISTACLL
jgi:hypothetical protein